MSSIYLDWAATAPPDPQIQEQMQQTAQQMYANPSALHAPGREAEKRLSECRQRLADLLGCGCEELVFTSGATESNNMVVFSLLHKKRDRRILISGIEHPSIYQPAQTLKQLGFEVVPVPADPTGRIDPDRVRSSLDEHTVLVAVMLVNNETGAVQPLQEIAEAIRDFQKRSGKKVLLHTDAVQACGKIPVNLSSLGVDSAAFSAHKIGGPRGVGALFVRSGRPRQFLYCGGGQEHGLRPGTENLPGIHGFVLAAEKALLGMEDNRQGAEQAMGTLLAELRDMREVVLIPNSRLKAEPAAFSPYILNFSIPPLPGEVLIRVLQEEGFTLSTGSACSSRKKDRFRVSDNMGIPREIAYSALRLSTGPGVRGGELLAFAAALRRRVPKLLQTGKG